jgi:uncharacterized membrane protein
MKKLLITSGLLMIIPALIWCGYMYGIKGLHLSDNNSDWGNFGSYYGGIVSPILSFFSIILLYKTIIQTDKNHSVQLEVTLKQDRRNQLIQLLKSYNEFLSSSISDLSNNFNDKFKSLPLYENDNIEIAHPKSTLRSTILDFQKNISTTKKFHPQYIDFIIFVSANAEYCLVRALEHAEKIKDTNEFEESIDLIETLADQHSTIGFLELNIRRLSSKDKKSPLLETLHRVNIRTKYLAPWSEKYGKIIEYKNNDGN